MLLAHRETHSTRQDADSLNFDLSRDAQRVDSLQLQSVLILQHVTAVHRHLQDTSRKFNTILNLISVRRRVWYKLPSQRLTLNLSLRTRKMISNVAPGAKGIWYRISSRPQRSFCSVLQTIHGDLLNLGLKWNATSALGFTLLPHVKSIWNLQDNAEGQQGRPAQTDRLVWIFRGFLYIQ